MIIDNNLFSKIALFIPSMLFFVFAMIMFSEHKKGIIPVEIPYKKAIFLFLFFGLLTLTLSIMVVF